MDASRTTAMVPEFEGDVIVGWWGTTFNRQGKPVRVFIPRRDEDIEADRNR